MSRSPSGAMRSKLDSRSSMSRAMGAASSTRPAGERALPAQTIDDVRFDLITPALAEVGARWERGAIGVADEHLASSVCEWLLFNLAGRASREAATGRRAATGSRAIVGCSDGELHSLGARIVAHVLAEH